MTSSHLSDPIDHQSKADQSIVLVSRYVGNMLERAVGIRKLFFRRDSIEEGGCAPASR